jgi:hypothetical protein
MTKRILFALLGASAVFACSSAGEPSADATDGGDTTTPPEGTAEGGDVPTEGSSSGSSGEALPAKNLALNGVTFRNVGRRGDTLRVGIKAADTRKETSAAIVRVLDANGAPVVTFDTDWDGVPDAAERRFHFDASTLGQASFLAAITIPGAYGPDSTIAKVAVTLEDELGNHSAPVTQALAKQVERAANESCDPQSMADRCPAGMACGGTPIACVEGVAPDLAKLAYYGGASPRMLFAGTEPDQDLKDIAVEFLDANGSPMSANLGTEDDPVMSSGIRFDATTATSGSGFFLASTPSAGFEGLVPRIAATVTDFAGHASSRLVVAASTMPVRAANAACDWSGFDACSAGNACAPGIPGEANVCKAKPALIKAKCDAAPALDPAKGATRTFGTTSGVSLWDAPACVSGDPVGRPESAVRLHLAKAAASLVITTALPETEFDTSVYVLPGCATSSSAALGCNDDERGYSSTLTLQNVAAGDYTIIVESFNMRGGRFGVSVEVK